MTFPASTQIKVDALQKVRRTANQLKANMQTRKDAMANGSVSGAYIIATMVDLKSAITTFDEVAAVAGISTYAQEQYEDSEMDIATEFTAMKTAAETARDWIITNLPQSNGFLAVRTMDSTGKISDR